MMNEPRQIGSVCEWDEFRDVEDDSLDMLGCMNRAGKWAAYGEIEGREYGCKDHRVEDEDNDEYAKFPIACVQEPRPLAYVQRPGFITRLFNKSWVVFS